MARSYRDPTGKERSQSFKRKRDAEDFAATVEADKLRGLWIDPARGKLTLNEWSKTWLKSKADLRATSRARLEGILRAHVLPGFGDVPLMDVGNAVPGWISSMIAGDVGASTVRKSCNALAQMMRAAVAERRVAFNPGDDVPLPPEHYGEQRFLSPTQVANLADTIEPRFRALVLLAVYGGLRFGEVAPDCVGGASTC